MLKKECETERLVLKGKSAKTASLRDRILVIVIVLLRIRNRTSFRSTLIYLPPLQIASIEHRL